MNDHEKRAWRLLIELGAIHIQLGGKHALKLSTIRCTNEKKLALYTQAVIEVAGRSGTNRRHVDRRGCPMFVITDDDLGPLPEPKRKGRNWTWVCACAACRCRDLHNLHKRSLNET